jgi:hypothetical protein
MSQEHTARAMESYRLAHLIMEGAVGAATGLPVLTTPGTAVGKLRRLLQR